MRLYCVYCVCRCTRESQRRELPPVAAASRCLAFCSAAVAGRLSSVKMIPTLFNASATPRSSTMSSAGKYSEPPRTFFRPHLQPDRRCSEHCSCPYWRSYERTSAHQRNYQSPLTTPTNGWSRWAGWPYPNNPPPPPTAAVSVPPSFSTSNAARNSRGVVCTGCPPSPLVQCEGPPFPFFPRPQTKPSRSSGRKPEMHGRSTWFPKCDQVPVNSGDTCLPVASRCSGRRGAPGWGRQSDRE